MSGIDLRIRDDVQRGMPFAIRFDGTEIPAYEGESVAAALWAAGIRAWPGAAERPPARTFFCAMGICQQCAVWINGAWAEACRTPASPGLDVRSRPDR